jgi:hypothetical protein
MRLSVWFALGAVVMISACEKRSAPPGGTADSTATATDSTATDSSMVGAKAPAKSPSDSIIGYDSAFGPIGTVDSTGKVVPIRPKRP